MQRQTLMDGSGWFDVDKAKHFEEDTYWDGSNMCSEATKDQWTHEGLYLTASGAWVLMHSSQWEGSQDRYELISPEEAARWLVTCDHAIPAQLESLVHAAEV
jgi:hypothetical protein